MTVVPITSQGTDPIFPAEILLPTAATGLKRDGRAQADQIRTVSVGRLRKRIGTIPLSLLADVERAIRIHLDLPERPPPQD